MSSHRCPSGMELELRLHYMSQRDNQGEFRDGGASVWTSPYEFQW